MEVLERAYGKIFDLQGYINAILQDAAEKLSENSKKPGFQKILKKTLIGMSSEITPKEILSPPLPSKKGDQMKVIEEVVKELIDAGQTTNVLTLGLSRARSDGWLPFYPDHNYTQLITPFWSKILNIIGRDAMKELLLNTSIFIEAESSCYIQLSGDPVHSIITTKSSPDKDRPEPSIPPSSSSHLSPEADDSIRALSLCYDKRWYPKFRKSHPLSSLPASITGAHRLVHEIFRIKNGGKICKTKMKRVPDRLRGIKDVLKKLLSNFKTARLEAFHVSTKKVSKSQGRSPEWFRQRSSSNLAEHASISDVTLERDVSESQVTGGVQLDSAMTGNRIVGVDGVLQQVPEGVTSLDYDERGASVSGGTEDAQHEKVEEMTKSDVGELKQKERSKSNSDEKDRSLELFSSPETNEPVDLSGTGGKETARSGWKRDPVTMETAFESNLGESTNESHADLEGLKASTSEIPECVIAVSSETSTDPENDDGNVEKDCLALRCSGNDSGVPQTEVIGKDKESLNLDSSSLSKERDEDITDVSGLLIGKDGPSGGSANIHGQKRCHEDIDDDKEDHRPKKSKRNDLSREMDNGGRKSDPLIDSDVIELLSSCEEVERVDATLRNEKSVQDKKVREKKGAIGAQNGAVTDPVSIGGECAPDDDTGASRVLKQCESTTKTQTRRRQDSTLNKGCDNGMPNLQSGRQRIIDNLKKKLRRRLKEKKKKKIDLGMRQWKRQMSMMGRSNFKFERNKSDPKMKMFRRKLRESEESSNSVPAQNCSKIERSSVNRGPNKMVLRRCQENLVAGTIQSIGGKTPQNVRVSYAHESSACCHKNVVTNRQITCCHGDSSLKGPNPASHVNGVNEQTVERKDPGVPLEDSPLAVGLSGTEVSVSLRGLLRKIVPMEMWGSTYNQKRFFKYVRHLVKLGRFEKLPLDLLTRSIKVSDCQWSRSSREDWKTIPETDRIKRKELAETMFRWLITDLVVPLIRLQYYVTETSNSKNELVYFPKRNWRQMEERAIADYKNLGIVSEVEEQTVRMMVIQQSTLGKSKLRFIPKEKGFRPIVRLGKSTLPGKEKFDINFLLRDVLDVLNYLRRAHSQFFGYSLLGVTSIYPRWKEFTMRRQQEGDTRPLYFVKVDISKCYDSIPHDKLFEVMTAVLNHKDLPETYAIRRYTVTSVTGEEGVRKKLKRYVSPEEGKHFDPRSSHQILVDLAKDGVHHKSIITNQASFHVKGVDSLLKRLRLLIYNDILCINKHDFVRTKGISHGSVLSSLLCSMFYGHMERTFLRDVDKDGLLMRLIDDFILITPHLDSATKFIETLFSDECTDTFGLSINPSKTLTNFDHVYEGQQLQQVKDEDWFPWCGFLFNMKTLEAKNDYLRYEASSIRYSMTVSYESDAIVKTMKTTLTRALLRSKGLLIFIDPVINSPDLIIENVYHLLLLTAFRFHSYFQALPQQLRNQDSCSLLKMILGIASAYHVRAKKSLGRLSEKSVFPLSVTAIKWLCVKAFHVKLSRHFSIHKGLVVRLRQKRINLSRKLDKTTRRALAKGSIPDIPAAFTKTRL